MEETAKSSTPWPLWLQRWRKRFAANLGVRLERKQEIYLDISKAATLRDSTYWLQILFAAGVATLGLVLNSPAVIIGAMLISPLMGPILAAGLALATGDLVLGIRAGANLLLSCLVAVTFSVCLIGLLPFKEMTAEIAARTQPTTLDLVVALFSGAIGSIATCKEVKGVVTSIPGVAIAVALMPPLCVVGYGIGLTLSFNGTDGLQVARGGGLLFLTNLVAITLMAMVVFLMLHIDVAPVRERAREWRKTDWESTWVRDLLGHYRVTDRLGAIGSLPGRLLVVLVPFLLILIPLSLSLSQLKREVAQQQAENRARRAANELWQQHFTKQANGEPRSFLDQLSLNESNGKLLLTLRVFDNQPYTEQDRKEYARLVAARLNRPVESVQVQLIEIPTAVAALNFRNRETPRLEAPPTVAQLRANFWQGVQSALSGLRLPPAAQLLAYRVVTGGAGATQVIIQYLADRDVEGDAQALITEEVRTRLTDATLLVRFERVPVSFGPLLFRRNETALSTANANLLLDAGQHLQQRPECRVEIITQSETNERAELAEARARSVAAELETKYQIAPARVTVTKSAESGRGVTLKLQTATPSQ
jgi:uncharacterized hydrophobic protein (TIGR00271 family)